MKPKDPVEDLVVAIREETAGALGRAGKKLGNAVAALAAFDQAGGQPEQRGQRELLLRDAADALYSYVIQKELMGAANNDLINKTFGTTPEMWRLMGVAHPSWRVDRRD
jgi:hypothetical protein